ncbi:hypothetical protein M8J77_015484 [Diaphorina citri]|nr:hypothetical protein M8J77_015484 [Diaphorina citri]
MPLITTLKSSMQRLLRRTNSVRSEKVCTSLVIPNKRYSLLVDTIPPTAPPNRPPLSPTAPPNRPPPSPPVKPMALGTVNTVTPPKAATPSTGGSVRYPSAEKSKTGSGGHSTSSSTRYKDRERHHRTHSQVRRQTKQVRKAEERTFRKGKPNR